MRLSPAPQILAVTLAILVSSCATRHATPDLRSLSDKAGFLAESLVKKDFYQAAKDFNRVLKDSLPPQKLEQVWKKTTESGGPFRKLSNVREGKLPPYDVVFVKCEFEKADIDVQIVFDTERKVAGLYFFPEPRP